MNIQMSTAPAPLFTDVCPGPDTGTAYWATTSDGVRVRLGVWPKDDARGTVLLFPGRTEYIEKYGPTANELATRGLATIAIDWRGQGLADRLLDEPRTGHVADFLDYQHDVAAMVALAKKLELPKPYFLLAHSMGGAIGLRSLVDGLDVKAAAFTGPMWGIRIAPHMRPLAWAMGQIMPALGKGHHLPPTLSLDPYVTTAPFQNNMLTTDEDQFQMMRDQLAAHPDLSLGGPSFIWLNEALSETMALANLPAPQTPCVTFLGTNERIVGVERIKDRMAGWNNGELVMVQNGEHEVLMEKPEMRTSILDKIAATFLGT
jgi:lysophospholipase